MLRLGPTKKITAIDMILISRIRQSPLLLPLFLFLRPHSLHQLLLAENVKFGRILFFIIILENFELVIATKLRHQLHAAWPEHLGTSLLRLLKFIFLRFRCFLTSDLLSERQVPIVVSTLNLVSNLHLVSQNFISHHNRWVMAKVDWLIIGLEYFNSGRILAVGKITV